MSSLRFASVVLSASLLFACGSDDDPSGSAGAAGSSGAGGSAGTGASGGSSGSSGSSGSAGSAGSGGSAGSAGSAGSPGEPGVRYIGRADHSQQGAVRMAWSGSGIVWRFEGTEASIVMDDAAGFFSVLVDGQELPRLETSAGEQTYAIVSGLPQATHQIELYRRTEALFGDTHVIGVELGGGTLLPPPTPAARRIELVGDSISCGYGNEGADQYCNFSADTENHYLTYGAIAARNLDAELVTVAWSGKGIVYNYGDDKDQPMPELYARTLPQDASSSWDFSWQPQVIVIHLGTNDFSTDDDPSPATFSGDYQAFLTDVRDKNPTAHIIAMVPTLLGGADLDAAESGIEAAVAARNAAGDAAVEAWSMTIVSDGWGCDWHPSLETHASMGAALTAKLESTMGW